MKLIKFISIALLLSFPAILSAEQADTYRIGISAPISGPLQQFGKWLTRGADMAVEEINSKGGIKGKKLELLYEDDKCFAKEAVTAVKKLQDVNQIDLFIVFCTAVAPPVADLTKDRSIVITPSFKTETLYKADYSHYFSLQPTMKAEMAALAAYMKGKDFKKLAIVIDQNDFHESYANFLIQEAEKLGIETVYDARVSREENDFKSHLLKIQSREADVVFQGFMPDQRVSFLKQFHEHRGTAALVSNWANQVPAVAALSPSLTDGIVYTYHYDALSGKPKDFADKYKESFDQASEVTSASVYDGIYIYSEALKECGPAYTLDCIKDYLNTMTERKGASGSFRFKDRSTDKAIFLKTVKNGKFINYSF